MGFRSKMYEAKTLYLYFRFSSTHCSSINKNLCFQNSPLRWKESLKINSFKSRLSEIFRIYIFLINQLLLHYLIFTELHKLKQMC